MAPCSFNHTWLKPVLPQVLSQQTRFVLFHRNVLHLLHVEKGQTAASFAD